jgi:sucrose phosphorylase
MADYRRISDLTRQIYGEAAGARAMARIVSLLTRYPKRARRKKQFFSERDVVLVTYGDSLTSPGKPPLEVFRRFAAKHLKAAVSAIHFLPFFPYSSDDGFSVMDFFAVDRQLGTWEDVAALGDNFELMFDYVVNHFSAGGQWFQNYLADKSGFEQFAIEVDPSLDLSLVTRPRSLPLLSPYEKSDGRKVHLWTTFSADQIDFNFKSLDVLEKMVEVLLFYVARGADVLRLDAIAYLWKEPGTPCIHLPQTHAMVKLFRAILDEAAPDVMLITETNVPHAENIGYFGNGRDEAQMVYNFTLPPLLFYSFVKEDATALSDWAGGLETGSDRTTFFNFTASHDGIGVRPLEGVLPAAIIDELARIVQQCGGRVSFKRNPDGTESPYELNITYVDAILGDPQSGRAQKFLASQAIQYALPGVPATYIHSLLGSRNWNEGVRQTGRARTINREKIAFARLEAELRDPQAFRSQVFYPYRDLCRTRRRQPAFHPNAGFEILKLDPRVFAIRRETEGQEIIAVTNVAGGPVAVRLPAPRGRTGPCWTDLITGRPAMAGRLQLKPYQYVWLTDDASSSKLKPDARVGP